MTENTWILYGLIGWVIRLTIDVWKLERKQ
jgi:hypothetical protein